MSDVFPPYNLPGEAVPWGREVQKRVLAGENSEAQLVQKVDNGLRAVSGQLTTLAEQVTGLAEVVTEVSSVVENMQVIVTTLDETVTRLDGVVEALPITLSSGERTTGGSLSGSWATVASTSITRPEGKTRVAVTGFGNASYLDDVTGGLTTSYLRIVINGVASGQFAAAKDAGVSKVANILSGAFTREFTAPSTVTVQLQAYALNGSAFPSAPQNYADISALATFS